MAKSIKDTLRFFFPFLFRNRFSIFDELVRVENDFPDMSYTIVITGIGKKYYQYIYKFGSKTTGILYAMPIYHIDSYYERKRNYELQRTLY